MNQPKTIFLIDGAAGSGKSDLLEFVANHLAGTKVTVLKKHSTRELRDVEKRSSKALDLVFVSEAEFSASENEKDFRHYRYPKKEGAKYGLRVSEIREALKSYDSIFIIIRSAATIKDLIGDFPDVCIIPIFVYTIESEIKPRLNREGYTDEEISFRLERTPEAMEDYYHHLTLYRYVIINNSDKRVFHQQLNEIFIECSKPHADMLVINHRDTYRLPSFLAPHKTRMHQCLERFPFDRNVFLMMKYRSHNELLYELTQAVLKEAGLNCVRADSSDWNITRDEIYNPFAVLYCCKYGIAVFDKAEEGATYNPNVVAELALMQMQDKHCLMLRHSSLPKPPFDLASRIYKDYANDKEISNLVRTWIRTL